MTSETDSTSAKFFALKNDWKLGRDRFSSSMTKCTNHPAYRAIVEMGWWAVPYIMAELKESPDWWFTALREITGENPVPPQSAGNLKEMSQAWIKWGETNLSPIEQ